MHAKISFWAMGLVLLLYKAEQNHSYQLITGASNFAQRASGLFEFWHFLDWDSGRLSRITFLKPFMRIFCQLKEVQY
jgi:hypothetical protein